MAGAKIYGQGRKYASRFANGLKAITVDIEVKISQVASGEAFNSTHTISMNKIQITIVNVDESAKSPASNVSHVKPKFDQLDDYRKVSACDNSGEVSVSGETMLDVPLKRVIYEETMVELDNTTLIFMSA